MLYSARADAAVPWAETAGGVPGVSAETPLPSVEIYEAQWGGLIIKTELITDSGGAATWRGGLGTETIIQLPSCADNFFLTVCVEASDLTSGGFAGGRPGSHNTVQLIMDGESHSVEQSLIEERLKPGAKLCLWMGRGAGWGPPWKRDPALVLADVLNGYVSLESAYKAYGVFIDPGGLTVKREATDRARKQLALAGTAHSTV